MAASRIMRKVSSILAQANKILNQTLNIRIQNHLVEGSSDKMKS